MSEGAARVMLRTHEVSEDTGQTRREVKRGQVGQQRGQADPSTQSPTGLADHEARQSIDLCCVCDFVSLSNSNSSLSATKLLSPQVSCLLMLDSQSEVTPFSRCDSRVSGATE